MVPSPLFSSGISQKCNDLFLVTIWKFGRADWKRLQYKRFQFIITMYVISLTYEEN